MSVYEGFDSQNSQAPEWHNQVPPHVYESAGFVEQDGCFEAEPQYVNDTDSAIQPIMTEDARRASFFGAIWPTEEHTYFCTFGRGSFVSWNVPDISTFVKRHTSKDLYFGIGQTSKAGTSGQRASRSGDGRPHVTSIACLFGDFDGQDFDSEISKVKALYKAEDKAAKAERRRPNYIKLPTIDPTQGKAGAWKALQDAESKVGPASFVIDSGGGYQAYWLLDKPIVIRQMLDAEDVRHFFAQWQAFIGSDKSAKDLERVYRVPYSYNCKPHYSGGPLLATVVRSDPMTKYNISDIQGIVRKPRQMELVEQEPKPARQKVTGKVKVFEPPRAEKTSADHERDIKLAAGYLKRYSQARCDNYSDWFNAACALKHRFTGTDQEEAAFKLWDEWSKKSKSYDSTEANKAKWETITTTTNPRNFGSLAYWANEDDPNPTPPSVLESLLEVVEDVENHDDLTDKLPELLDQALDLTTKELTLFCRELTKRNVKKGDIGQFRSDLKAIKKEREKLKKNDKLRKGDQVVMANDNQRVNLLGFEINDAGNMEAFRALYGAFFRHVEQWGWLTYNGTHWEKQGAEKRVIGRLRDMLRGRIKAALRLDDEGKLKSYLRNCAPTTKNINACMFQVKNDIELDKTTDDFDRHPFLINVANGTLDLRSGTLFAHDSALMITHCLDTAFNPNADVTLITNFLSGLGLSISVIDYLQQSTGYTLTGSTREECLFYIYGPTRSGKGTFVSALRSLLGSTLSAEITFETLTGSGRDADKQNFALAPLKPCRLVVASESGKYSTMNEQKVKNITGGDSIHCAFKGKTHFNYKPSFKIWLTSNHPPKADVNDDAFWKSRLKLIEFPHSFLGAEDKGLKDMLMNDQAYKEALLLWAVQGAMAWYNSPRGLEPPVEVVEATQSARDQLDYVRQWLDECTEDDSESRVTNAVLYASYENWCDENGVNAKKKRSFGRDMVRKGYEAKRWKAQKKTFRGFAGLLVVS